MTIAALGKISDMLSEAGINYQFGAWTTDPVPNPFFVGEYFSADSPERDEDSMQETTFILTGTGTEWITLVSAQQVIEALLPFTGVLSNGNGLSITYSGSTVVPVDDASYKRLQINLTIKEWLVNIYA